MAWIFSSVQHSAAVSVLNICLFSDAYSELLLPLNPNFGSEVYSLAFKGPSSHFTPQPVKLVATLELSAFENHTAYVGA